MKGLLAALAVTSLCACAQNPTAQLSTAIDQLRTFSSADLAAAQAKATEAGDEVGALCWKKLATVPSAPGTTLGVASIIEDARIVKQAVSGPCSGFSGGFLPIPLSRL